MYRDTWPRDTRIVSPPKYHDILDDTACGESRYIGICIAIQVPIYRDSYIHNQAVLAGNIKVTMCRFNFVAKNDSSPFTQLRIYFRYVNKRHILSCDH